MGLGLARAGGVHPAALRDSAAMRAAQHQQRPPCGWDNDSHWKVGRRKCGRAFPVGLGVAGMGVLHPAVWCNSGAMGGSAHHAALAMSALLMEQRPSFGDWATGKQQGAFGELALLTLASSLSAKCAGRKRLLQLEMCLRMLPTSRAT